jgi:hypothetical protein
VRPFGRSDPRPVFGALLVPTPTPQLSSYVPGFSQRRGWQGTAAGHGTLPVRRSGPALTVTGQLIRPGPRAAGPRLGTETLQLNVTGGAFVDEEISEIRPGSQSRRHLL